MFYIYGFVDCSDVTNERRDFVMLKADGTLGGFDGTPVLVVKNRDGAYDLKDSILGDLSPYFNIDDAENIIGRNKIKIAKHW